MVKTYTGTLFHTNDLPKATIDLMVYDVCKYEATQDTEPKKVQYTGVKAWDIITGEDAEALEQETDCIDDYHEYLRLHFVNGTTATYRNSYVSMFIW